MEWKKERVDTTSFSTEQTRRSHHQLKAEETDYGVLCRLEFNNGTKAFRIIGKTAVAKKIIQTAAPSVSLRFLLSPSLNVSHVLLALTALVPFHSQHSYKSHSSVSVKFVLVHKCEKKD